MQLIWYCFHYLFFFLQQLWGQGFLNARICCLYSYSIGFVMWCLCFSSTSGSNQCSSPPASVAQHQWMVLYSYYSWARSLSPFLFPPRHWCQAPPQIYWHQSQVVLKGKDNFKKWLLRFELWMDSMHSRTCRFFLASYSKQVRKIVYLQSARHTSTRKEPCSCRPHIPSPAAPLVPLQCSPGAVKDKQSD